MGKCQRTAEALKAMAALGLLAMVGSNRLTNVLAERLPDSNVGDATVREEHDSHVVLSDDDVGEFYKVVREMDLETNVWRSESGGFEGTSLRGWVAEE